MNRLFKDKQGGALLEFAVVFPVVLIISMGVLDLGYALWQWNAAAKATHWGARQAIVTDAVALGVASPGAAPLVTGQRCTLANGSANAAAAAACVIVGTVCVSTGGSTGSCTNISNGAASPYTFQNTPFQAIVDKMRNVYPAIARANVQVSYTYSGLGFAGRAGGQPVNVTVSLRCMKADLALIGPLLKWVFPAFPVACGLTAGIPIPPLSTTLTSENMGG